MLIPEGVKYQVQNESSSWLLTIYIGCSRVRGLPLFLLFFFPTESTAVLVQINKRIKPCPS